MIDRASFAPCAHSLFVVVSAAFFACAALAAGGNVPARPAPQNPELSVRTIVREAQQAPATALTISMMDVEVAITGNVARTTVTTKFVGTVDADLEGTFTFDMPPNSVVTGYALDIGDKMVDGVLVGQRKARLVFDARVRAGIDPGLAEVTRTGAFKTRVFPIRRQGRTVRLEFVTPLDPSRDLSIPLVTQARVGEFSVRVNTDASRPPRVKGPNGIDLDWRPSGNGGLEAEGHVRNAALSGALVVTAVPGPAVQVARASNGDVFFDISDVAVTGRAKPPPARVRIYWDTSRSHRDADLDKEIALAASYVDKVHPRAVDLVLFSSGAPVTRSFPAATGTQIGAALKAVEYQGGTALTRAPDTARADACLLFTDGNATAGAFKPPLDACPWFTVSSAADANRALLDVVARKSGGDYVDLTVENADIALSRVAHPLPRVVGVRVSPHDRPSGAEYVVLPAGLNRFRVIGRTQGQSSGTISVLLAGAAQDVRSYNVDFAAKPNDAVAALWAARRIDEMRAEAEPDQDALAALSRRYGVASQAASFVVFENASDYVEADVEPPPSAGKEMIAEYRRAKEARDSETATAQRERLNDVAALWDAQRQWWVHPPKPERPKRAEAGDSRDDAARREPPRPSPPPVPPPARPTESSNAITPAPAPAPAPADAVVDTTTVTGVRMPSTQGLVSASPLQAVGSQEVQATGTERLANQLPQGFADTDGRGRAREERPVIGVTIAKWDPKRPYIAALNKANPAEYDAVYHDQERTQGTLPAFYLDVAEFFFRHGKRAEAIPVALNALELPVSDTTTMTIVADRLMRYGDEDGAIWLYERLIYLEPDRPQPLRNLALALMARADRTGPRAESAEARRRDYTRAVELLNKVITRTWPDAYEGVEIISLMEANRAVRKLRAMGVTDVALDKRLIAMLDVDLRVVLEWNTDATDMDLWVDEPTGERAIYDNPKTAIGGRLSNDMTSGYGPEEYLLHRAPNGTYTVRVNVYNTDRLDPNGATTVRAHVFRNYGRTDEREEVLELELTRDGTIDARTGEPRERTDGAHLIGTIRVGPDAVRRPNRGHRP